jgi:hypothetical protein
MCESGSVSLPPLLPVRASCGVPGGGGRCASTAGGAIRNVCGAAGQAEASEALPPVSMVAMWEEPDSVVGVHWIDGPVLCVLCEHGPQTQLRLYSAAGRGCSASVYVSVGPGGHY